MEPDNKKKTSTETDNEPDGILDNESYIKLKDPESEGFGNKSKDIDKIDVTGSPNVVDYYKYMVYTGE